MNQKPKPTPAETLQAAVRLLGLASWLMVGLAIVQAFLGDMAQVNNALLLAVLLRLLRQEMWMNGLLTITTDALMKPFRRIQQIAGIGSKPDGDPFGGEAFGDVPHLGQRDEGKDSNEKKGE